MKYLKWALARTVIFIFRLYLRFLTLLPERIAERMVSQDTIMMLGPPFPKVDDFK